MRVRDLESQLFEPRGSRQHDIRKTPGRLVHKQIDASDQLCLVEAAGDVSGIGERRHHVGAQKQQDLQPPVGQSLCDVRHLVWKVASRWTPFRRAQVPQAGALRAMTWPKSTSWKTKIASQRRQ